jgi:hypothetical protein
LEAVQYLVEKVELDPDELGENGMRPIDSAAIAGNLDIVKYFVEKHNVNPFVAAKKYNAKQFAEMAKMTEVIKYLNSLQASGKFKAETTPANSKVQSKKHSREPSRERRSDGRSSASDPPAKKPKLHHEQSDRKIPRQDDLRSQKPSRPSAVESDIPRVKSRTSVPDVPLRKSSDTLKTRVASTAELIPRNGSSERKSSSLNAVKPEAIVKQQTLNAERKRSPTSDATIRSHGDHKRASAPSSGSAQPSIERRPTAHVAATSSAKQAPAPLSSRNESSTAIPKFPSSGVKQAPPAKLISAEDVKAKEAAESRAQNLRDMIRDMKAMKAKLKLQLEVYETCNPKYLDNDLIRHVQRSLKE